MDFVDNIDLIARLVGRIVDLLAKVADVVNAGVAGGINLNEINRATVVYCLAQGAGITRLTLAISKAVYRFGQDTTGAGLAGAAWTAEEIGVRYPTAAQGIKQCLGDMLLTNYFGEGLRTPFAIKDLR